MEMMKIFLLIVFQGFPLGYVCFRIRNRAFALLGSCVELPCTHMLYKNIEMSDVVWFSGRFGEEEILNTKNLSSVNEKYRNRTSLIPGENNCTLRIDPVREEDENYYYSDNADDRRTKDFYEEMFNSAIILYVTDYPEDLDLSVSEYLMEGNATIIRCAVDHTCGSSPPTLRWNKPGHIETRSKNWYGEYWTEESELTYIPSFMDDETSIRCTATHPNGQQIEKSAELKVHFAPKFVTVTIIENGKIMEGSDVTLACTSISRPEVSTYEWYKGENRTTLPYTGWKMTVRNVTRDEDLYSCAAMNTLGIGESELTKITVLYEGSNHSFLESNCNTVLLSTIITVCPLLLVLLLCFIWRCRRQKVTSSKAVESPDATYTDLIKKDIDNDYENLKTGNSTHITLTGRH